MNVPPCHREYATAALFCVDARGFEHSVPAQPHPQSHADCALRCANTPFSRPRSPRLGVYWPKRKQIHGAHTSNGCFVPTPQSPLLVLPNRCDRHPSPQITLVAHANGTSRFMRDTAGITSPAPASASRLDILASPAHPPLTALLPAGKKVDECISFLQRSRQNQPVRENGTPLRAVSQPNAHAEQDLVAR